jgi:hypothetical protein
MIYVFNHDQFVEVIPVSVCLCEIILLCGLRTVDTVDNTPKKRILNYSFIASDN